MDSLRVPKGSGSKSSGSIPLAIKFNAGEESLEDIIKPSESLSSSPQQNSEDFSWRKEFLHGNFFHRKRSGSVEGTPTGGGTLISNLSSSDTNAVGTWKLIKGKVSQAMEDIKASKSVHAIAKADGNEDSDLETINSSISDELPADILKPGGGIPGNETLIGNKTDSDSDIDPDIFLTADDLEQSTIRKSFANLRSKAISKHHKSSRESSSSGEKHGGQNTAVTTGSGSSSRGGGGIRPTFLRRRKKHANAQAHPSEGSTQQISTDRSKKEVEIESGIEMLEDMILPTYVGSAGGGGGSQNESCEKVTNQDEVLITFSKESIITFQGGGKISRGGVDDENLLNLNIPPNVIKKSEHSGGISNFGKNRLTSDDIILISKIKTRIKNMRRNSPAIITFLLFVIFVIMPLPDFFRGVIACLFTISFFTYLTDTLKIYMERKNNGNGPERGKFEIPDYGSMPIYEIPAAKEHKPLKSYSGWMNEINNYDPANYHISMTRSVFVRLDGPFLRLCNTTARIPKRAIWNEPPIDRRNITFTQNRHFNLLGCRVEMCPRGLARKRYFSRKYPIQLIIKNNDNVSKEETSTTTEKHYSTTQLDENEPKLTTSVESNLQQQQQQQQQIETSSASTAPVATATTTTEIFGVIHQSSNDSIDDKSDRTQMSDLQSDLDFATAIMNSDLQKLHENREISSKDSVPCGDETRILLFARCDREKEDWYRRFYAASTGAIYDQELHMTDIVMVTDEEVTTAIKETSPEDDNDIVAATATATTDDSKKIVEDSQQKRDSHTSETSLFEGLLMSPCSARSSPEYLRFMSTYQKACTQSSIPVMKNPLSASSNTLPKRSRRQKRQEDELWKGIDQSLYLGPSGSVVWANVLIGRILYSCLNDAILLEKMQDFLQRKLGAIRLPSFMEDVVISEVYLGDTPPLIHRVSQPLLDERGTWIDADVTYEGLMHMTITTKLNLLRLKRQQTGQQSTTLGGGNGGGSGSVPTSSPQHQQQQQHDETITASESMQLITDGSTTSGLINCAIYDSNAESSGVSSSESESPNIGIADPMAESQAFYATPGSSRKFLRIVDRITASNLFQSATEIPYIQRAMENMSTKITLRVDLKGLVSRVVINLPAPPSDRLWIAFRGPPRLWISAKPAVGDHTFDWSIVTNVIESKLCEEVYKYLVYPNMVDIIVPFLGQPTYKE